MIVSMTGFGEARAEDDGVRYHVEIRSLNNRYFKAAIKVPEQFQRYETEIDKLLRSRMGRGSITYMLRVKDDNPSAAYQVNTGVLAEYVRQLRQVAGNDSNVGIDLTKFLEVPGVFQPADADDSVLNRRFGFVRKLSEEAIDKVIEMRRAEGKALQADLQAQCAEIRNRLEAIRQRGPAVVEDYRRRLRTRVGQLIGGLDGSNIELYQDSLAREVAIFAERCDVNEEISRIASHLDQFEALSAVPELAGRKLDFLAQEMMREANTIGSKASDAEVSRQVVEIKAAVDRVKEQVQNVE